MKKFALFVFNGDPMCFIHVLLNAMNMKEKGHVVKIIMEGSSVKLIPELFTSQHPLNKLWGKAIDQDLVEGACRACSAKLGTLKDAEEHGIKLLDGMAGHPSMTEFMDNGFEIITF